jgi:hypothetical protein
MRLLTLTFVLVLGFAQASLAGQQGSQWQVGVSTFASEGNYGTADTTRLIYTSLSVRRMFPRGDITVRVPWLDVRSDGTVLVFRDVAQPIPTRQTVRTVTQPMAVRQTTRASGPGDVGMSGRIFLIPDRRAPQSVDLTARLELPTGDASRGLGLGKASVEIGLEVSQALGPFFVALADGSFTATGRPDDLAVRNPWEYAIGVGAYIGRPVLLSVSYEQWRPVIPGTPMGRDLLAATTIAIGRLRLLASAQLPLSDQAPDFGAGAGLAVRF